MAVFLAPGVSQDRLQLLSDGRVLRHGLRYTKQDNAFLWLEDFARAQTFADRFTSLGWVTLLDRYARRMNPLLRGLLAPMQAESECSVSRKRCACCDLAHFFTITISTRRFFCLPSGSSDPSGLVLGATGFLAPKPAVENRTFLRPSFWTSQSLTELARRSERV